MQWKCHFPGVHEPTQAFIHFLQKYTKITDCPRCFAPTISPTVSPTINFTHSPSYTPTAYPSHLPSTYPTTGAPSVSPSNTPTIPAWQNYTDELMSYYRTNLDGLIGECRECYKCPEGE